MIYKLQYFRKSQNGICATDFENERLTDFINLNFLLSLSDLGKFYTITDRYVDKFAIVTMSNDDKYYIDEKSFKDLSGVLSAREQACV